MGTLWPTGFLASEDSFAYVVKSALRGRIRAVHGNFLSACRAGELGRPMQVDADVTHIFLSNIMDYFDPPGSEEGDVGRVLAVMDRLASPRTRVLHCHCVWPNVYYMNHEFDEWRTWVCDMNRQGVVAQEIWARYVRYHGVSPFLHMWSDEFAEAFPDRVPS
jgi:hypothetical protein